MNYKLTLENNQTEKITKVLIGNRDEIIDFLLKLFESYKKYHSIYPPEILYLLDVYIVNLKEMKKTEENNSENNIITYPLEFLIFKIENMNNMIKIPIDWLKIANNSHNYSNNKKLLNLSILKEEKSIVRWRIVENKIPTFYIDPYNYMLGEKKFNKDDIEDIEVDLKKNQWIIYTIKNILFYSSKNI